MSQVGVISPSRKISDWTEDWASRTTVPFTITNRDGSVFPDTDWVLAVTEDGTPLATTEDDNSTAITRSADGLTLSGSLYLNTVELITDRMDVLAGDKAAYELSLVSQDKTKAPIVGAIVIWKTDYYFGAEDPTDLTGGSFNDLAEIGVALADTDTFAVYDLSRTTYYKSLMSRLWTYIKTRLNTGTDQDIKCTDSDKGLVLKDRVLVNTYWRWKISNGIPGFEQET